VVTPDEVKRARTALQCTTKELAAALGVDAATVAGWERGELFPTKKHVEELARLVAAGPSAVPKRAKGPDPLEALRDPDVWTLLRKILAHPKLRAEVARIAEKYEDP
jgi:transcriptional regulator with XRE-family HTH domain